jgi:hypothetical protein
MIGRRTFIAGLGSAVAWPLTVYAQQAQLQILRLQAEGAADKIGQFIGEIVGQVGWITQMPTPPAHADALVAGWHR